MITRYKIQARLIGMSSVYYEIYRKKWLGWERLDGHFGTQEQAKAHLDLIAHPLYIDIEE